MLAGYYKGEKVGVNALWEAVGKVGAGLMTEEELKDLENRVCHLAARAAACTLQHNGMHM